MNSRHGISVRRRRRSSTNVIEGRNRISLGSDYEEDINIYELETELLIARMRNMSAEEASAFAAEAVAEAELAMSEAAEALREAEAAEAEAQAAATFAAACKKKKSRTTRKMKPCSEESSTRGGQPEESPSA